MQQWPGPRSIGAPATAVTAALDDEAGAPRL
jgi:hypothetical protein